MPRTRDPIYTLANGKKQIRYRDQTGEQRKETYNTVTEARARLAEIRTDLRRGTYVAQAASAETFGSFTVTYVKSRDWKPTGGTWGAWQSASARVMPTLGPLPLSSIDRLTLQTLQVDLRRRYARNTVITTMAFVRAILRAAVATGRLGRDPTLGLEPPKIRATDRIRVDPTEIPTQAELTAIWQAAPPPYRAAIALGASGLRVSEVVAICAGQLDETCGRLVVDRQLQYSGGHLVETTPKNEHVRTIVLAPAVAFELRRHRYEHQGGGRLFRSPGGADLDRATLYRLAWYPALADVGLDRRYKFHALRHFCASTLLSQGVSIAAVAGYIGDAVQTVQRTYAHWLRDDENIPAEVLQRWFAPADPASNSETG